MLQDLISVLVRLSRRLGKLFELVQHGDFWLLVYQGWWIPGIGVFIAHTQKLVLFVLIPKNGKPIVQIRRGIVIAYFNRLTHMCKLYRPKFSFRDLDLLLSQFFLLRFFGWIVLLWYRCFGLLLRIVALLLWFLFLLLVIRIVLRFLCFIPIGHDIVLFLIKLGHNLGLGAIPIGRIRKCSHSSAKSRISWWQSSSSLSILFAAVNEFELRQIIFVLQIELIYISVLNLSYFFVEFDVIVILQINEDSYIGLV